MIKNLTDKQLAKIPTYVEKWNKIGISTSDLDVENSLKQLRKAYKHVNLPFPKQYEIYDSPFAAIKAMKEKYQLDISPSSFIYGAHDSPWLSNFNYFEEVCNLEICKNLNPFMELAKYCGWALLFDELVVLTKKPSSIKWDDLNRTHCEDDYAIKFHDGTGITIWHGLTVPEEWIFDKSSITPDILLHWTAIEQRRAACEIVGWINVLKLLNAVTIDEDGDPTIGKLLEVEIPDIGTERFLVVLDPNTNREIGLSVPIEMETALEANSWTYGIEKFEFKPDFRV